MALTKYEMSDILQHYAVLLNSDNYAKDYGTGKKYTAVEAHTVSYIGDHPGCTVSQIAYDWGKTPGAASQMVKKLRKYGLVEAVRDSQDEKRVMLTLTDEGRELDRCHRAFDESVFIGDQLLKKYSYEEISHAFEIMQECVAGYCRNKAMTQKNGSNSDAQAKSELE